MVPCVRSLTGLDTAPSTCRDYCRQGAVWTACMRAMVVAVGRSCLCHRRAWGAHGCDDCGRKVHKESDVLLPRLQQGRDSMRQGPTSHDPEHTHATAASPVWLQCVFPHPARRGAEHRTMLQGYRKGMYASRLRATGRVRRIGVLFWPSTSQPCAGASPSSCLATAQAPLKSAGAGIGADRPPTGRVPRVGARRETRRTGT